MRGVVERSGVRYSSSASQRVTPFLSCANNIAVVRCLERVGFVEGGRAGRAPTSKLSASGKIEVGGVFACESLTEIFMCAPKMLRLLLP